MKIAVLTGPATFTIDDVAIPDIAADEVLVRVAACGVCASELEMWEGSAGSTYPLFLGHEVSGTVVDVGVEVTDFSAGDGVGVWVTARGYAEYVAVKAEYCRSAADIPLDLVMAEPLACAANAVELADVRLGDDVVLIGSGFMGNLVQEFVALRGARQIIVADARPEALEHASALGATHVVDVRTESLPQVVAELTGGVGADVTFECTGTQGALSGVGDVTRMSGKIALVGFHQGAPREISLAHWNWMAFQIINAHFREVATIMRGMTIGMRLLTAGQLNLDRLITHRFALDDIATAFEAARQKPSGYIKAVVTP